MISTCYISSSGSGQDEWPVATDTVSVVSVVVRRARTADVPAIKAIVDIYAGSGRKLLAKELVTLYEDVQDFLVAESDARVVGCGALHVLWSDLGEVRTVAVHPDQVERGIGQHILQGLIDTARELGLSRLFALTFQTRFFASHGFAGTIDSTLRLKLARPSSQPQNGNFPPGIKTQRVRTVIEQLSLVRVRGGLTATVRGAGNPIVCGLLDSCGLSETLSLAGPLRGASGELIATGPARRPYADFLAALGLSRTGRGRGIAVSGTVGWAQPVQAEMSQAGNLCTDAAARGGVAIELGLGGASGGFTDTWRTRCPGPSLRNTQPFLGGPLDRSALGQPQFRIDVHGKAASSDDGYAILGRGRLSLVLRRGRITQQVSTEPTD